MSPTPVGMLLSFCGGRPVLTQLTCLWGPLRMCARAPSHAVLMASIDGVPSRSVIRSSWNNNGWEGHMSLSATASKSKVRPDVRHHSRQRALLHRLATSPSDSWITSVSTFVSVPLMKSWDLTDAMGRCWGRGSPAGWDSGPGRGCGGPAAPQRCSRQTRCQWSWNSGGCP